MGQPGLPSLYSFPTFLGAGSLLLLWGRHPFCPLWPLSPFGTSISPSAGLPRALMGIGVEPCYPPPLVLVSET